MSQIGIFSQPLAYVHTVNVTKMLTTYILLKVSPVCVFSRMDIMTANKPDAWRLAVYGRSTQASKANRFVN